MGEIAALPDIRLDAPNDGGEVRIKARRIVAIPHSVLGRVGGDHSVSGIVEQQTR